MPEHSGKKYFFESIVDDKKDLIGIVGYSLYKIKKTEFIKKSKGMHTSDLTDEQLDRYQEDELTKISQYREEATEILENIINKIINEKNKQISIEMQKIERKNEEIKQAEEKNKNLLEREKEVKKKEKMLENREKYCKNVTKTSFLSGVGQSILGTIIWTILVVFIIKFAQYDIISHLLKVQK